MRSTRLFSAGRPALLGLTLFLAGVMCTTAVMRSDAAQAAQSGGMTFASDAGLIFSIIKPDQTAAFEASITKMKEAFAKSENAQRKQQAAGWVVYKAVEPSQGNVVYVSVINPTVKDADYNVFKIISEVFPTEAQELYKNAQGAFVSMSKTSLMKLADFK